ncbi:50S ribosomal protein L28 [Candidatus Nasuia deltocephalinicola]|nr:50S ribosomal protein L28 [Candidatus Nasuia deltocephalinicola]
MKNIKENKKIIKIFKKKPLIGKKISHSNKKNKRIFKKNIKKKIIFFRKNKNFLKINIPVKKFNNFDKLNNYLTKNDIKYEK